MTCGMLTCYRWCCKQVQCFCLVTYTNAKHIHTPLPSYAQVLSHSLQKNEAHSHPPKSISKNSLAILELHQPSFPLPMLPFILTPSSVYHHQRPHVIESLHPSPSLMSPPGLKVQGPPWLLPQSTARADSVLALPRPLYS